MDVEDYVDVLRRHKGWIMGPTFAGLVIAVVVAFVWPDTYVSDAMIRIVPPSVPERYVASNVNLQVGQRIASMSQQVLSRSNLQALINENNLYPRKKNRVPDADIVEQMQKDIQFRPVSALREPGALSTAFRISFAYENRYTAQKVVSKIVSALVDTTTTMRSNESTMTTEFLKDKVAAAKKDLDEIENQLTTYKLRFCREAARAVAVQHAATEHALHSTLRHQFLHQSRNAGEVAVREPVALGQGAIGGYPERLRAAPWRRPRRTSG